MIATTPDIRAHTRPIVTSDRPAPIEEPPEA